MNVGIWMKILFDKFRKIKQYFKDFEFQDYSRYRPNIWDFEYQDYLRYRPNISSQWSNVVYFHFQTTPSPSSSIIHMTPHSSLPSLTITLKFEWVNPCINKTKKFVSHRDGDRTTILFGISHAQIKQPQVHFFLLFVNKNYVINRQ